MQFLISCLSMRSHSEEFAGAMGLLTERPDIQFEQIFGIGHSEGTLHVLNYHLNSPQVPLAGLVVMGPPERAVGPLARSQLAAQATLPNGDALLALYDAAIARFLGGPPVVPDRALLKGVQALLTALQASANLPFARELSTADAASLLGKVDVPVLVVTWKESYPGGLAGRWNTSGMCCTRTSRGDPVLPR